MPFAGQCSSCGSCNPTTAATTTTTTGTAPGSPLTAVKNRRRGKGGRVANGKLSNEQANSSDEEVVPLTQKPARRPIHLDTAVVIDQEVTDNEALVEEQKKRRKKKKRLSKRASSTDTGHDSVRKSGEDEDDEESEEEEEFNDYISAEMNYKETRCRSPPTITIRDASRNSFTAVDRDDVSLYGTPRDENGPGQFGDTKPSFMKCQIELLFQPSDNKLAMKLFGSKKALMKERLRQKESGHWIIHPCSNFR